MSKKKKDNKIRLISLGASTSQVTGSAWKLQYKLDSGEIASQQIECGLPQGKSTILEQYNDAKRMVDAVKGGGHIEECCNLFLLHPH